MTEAQVKQIAGTAWVSYAEKHKKNPETYHSFTDFKDENRGFLESMPEGAIDVAYDAWRGANNALSVHEKKGYVFEMYWKANHFIYKKYIKS